MEKITKPLVKTLAEGSNYKVKVMNARGGSILPSHCASAESVVFVHEG